MDSEEALQLKGLEELPPLPFVDAYGLGSFYCIRECYDEDYKFVKSMLERKKRSIGKSIFYAYFFKRYRKEMKGNDTWIIAAAYEGGKLNGAIAFKEHDDVSVKLRNERAIDDFVEEADRENKNVILMSDGPPKRIRS